MSLSHPEILRKMLSEMSCDFRFYDFALNTTGEVLEGLPLEQRIEVLCFDKLRITGDISFNIQAHGYNGFIKAGPELIS